MTKVSSMPQSANPAADLQRSDVLHDNGKFWSTLGKAANQCVSQSVAKRRPAPLAGQNERLEAPAFPGLSRQSALQASGNPVLQQLGGIEKQENGKADLQGGLARQNLRLSTMDKSADPLVREHAQLLRSERKDGLTMSNGLWSQDLHARISKQSAEQA